MSILDDLKNIDLNNVDLKNKQTQTMLAVVAVFLAAAAAYIYFVFVPQAGRVVALSVKTVSMKSELKGARITITGIDKLKNGLKEHSEKVESYERKLPAEQEIPALLENLSNMAKDSSIKIIGIIPSLSALKDDKSAKMNQIYQEIPILITAKSGYHELGRFLDNLENADRFMKVADISIKYNKTSPKKHDVELMVCTYILLAGNR